jgi:hypothetical protein
LIAPGPWAARVFRVVGYTLVGMALLKFDPAEIGTVTNGLSQDIFYKVIAPTYGEEMFGGPARAPDGGGLRRVRWNEHMTVLLLDDSALKVLGESWPIPRATHADLLWDLYQTYRPRVIMVDILFFDRRPGEDADLARLRKVLGGIKKDGTTKVFLASDGSAPEASPSTAFASLAGVAELVAVSWDGTGRSTLYYPLATGAGVAGNGKAPGPAYAIYRYLCATALPSVRAAMHCPQARDFGKLFATPMQVVWGVRAPDLNWEQANRGIRCRTMSKRMIERVWQYARLSLFGESKDYPQTCPYAQIIKVRDFADQSFRNLGDVKAAYRKALGQDGEAAPKIVFYGARFKGAEDVVETPTHGGLAGVHLHAMALDNLLTLGSGYIRMEGDSRRLLIIEWLLALAVVTLAVVVRDLRAAGLSRGGTPTGLLRIDLRLFVIIPFIYFVMYVSFVHLRLAPINWVGFLGFAGLVELVDSRRMERWATCCFRKFRRTL